MRILFYYPTPFVPKWGGVERVTFILSDALIKRGHTVFFLHLPSSYQYQDYSLEITPFFLPCNELMAQMNVDYYNLLVQENHIDVIINQHGLFEGAYFIATLKDTKPIIISVIHNNPILEYANLWYLNRILKNGCLIEKFKRIFRIILYPKIRYSMYKRIIRHYDFLLNNTHIICLLSSTFLPILKHINPKLIDKTVVINNPNTYDEVKSMPNKENIVLYVGRLQNRQKNISTLIDIWKSIKITNWLFVIVGDGPDRSYLEELIDGCDNIKMIGYADPLQYYQKAKIFCMTSIYEGFPMALTEAMQFGCVPIAFDSFPAVRDLIIPGETGELVKSFNKAEYIHKLSRLMFEDRYRDSLSSNGFKYVKKYNIANIIPQWLALIEK